jgi:hypothetical protein
MQPVRTRGGAPANGALNRYSIGVSSLDTIGRNDPVALVSGLCVRLSGAGVLPFGVAQSFLWTDSTTKRPVWLNTVPAGTSSASGTNVYALVVDDPNATFIIQSDATVSAADIGFNFTLSAVGSCDANIGLSNAVLKKSTRTSGAGHVKVLGVYDIVGNAVDDAFTIVEVCWTNQNQFFATSVSPN